MNEISKILAAIVDDNATLANQLKENLQATGNIEIIFIAANGEEALTQLHKTPRLPQVILMDIEMPVMNGIEATAIISKETGIKILNQYFPAGIFF